ncbi:MAG: response regulator [Candidatus Zixiibacteriota bacterium]
MSFKIKLDGAKVFVIDDEPEITELIQSFLEEQGYRVLTVNDPHLAVEKARNFKPDVILLDIIMPDVDGYELCQKMKSDAELGHVPVVFLTGRDRGEDMGRSFKSGGDMFIKKPFSCERLQEIVNIVLMSSGQR